MPSLLFLFCIFEKILISNFIESRLKNKTKSINKKRKQTIHLLKECIGMWPLLNIDSCFLFSFFHRYVPCDYVTRTYKHTLHARTTEHIKSTYILDKNYMFIKYSVKTIRKKKIEEEEKKKTKQCHQRKWEGIQQ